MSLRIGRFFEMGTARGEPLLVGDRRLVPTAWTLSVRVGRMGGPLAAAFTWTRPTAVEVSDSTGTRRIPIVDPGRWVVVGLMAAAALPALAAVLRGGYAGKRNGGGNDHG